MRTLNRINEFEPRHPGAFQAYLRSAVENRIRDEVRRVGRRGVPEELPEPQEDESPSPLEEAIGQEAVERYEAALQRLRPEDREAIIYRVELQYSFDELKILTPRSAEVRCERLRRFLGREVVGLQAAQARGGAGFVLSRLTLERRRAPLRHSVLLCACPAWRCARFGIEKSMSDGEDTTLASQTEVLDTERCRSKQIGGTRAPSG